MYNYSYKGYAYMGLRSTLELDVTELCGGLFKFTQILLCYESYLINVFILINSLYVYDAFY